MRYFNNAITQSILFLIGGIAFNRIWVNKYMITDYIQNLNWYGMVCGFSGALLLCLMWWGGYIVSLWIRGAK